MPVVIIIDQKNSRNDIDRIPMLVDTLNVVAERHVVMPFQRTVGDECEGVLKDLSVVPDLVALIARHDTWWIGIGVGAIAGIAADSRDVNGQGFGIARDMIDRAKRRTRRSPGEPRKPWPLRFSGVSEQFDQAFEGCLATLWTLISSRSPRECEVAALLSSGADQREIAAKLGISQPGVSKAISRSHWDHEKALMSTARYMAREVVR